MVQMEAAQAGADGADTAAAAAAAAAAEGEGEGEGEGSARPHAVTAAEQEAADRVCVRWMAG